MHMEARRVDSKAQAAPSTWGATLVGSAPLLSGLAGYCIPSLLFLHLHETMHGGVLG